MCSGSGRGTPTRIHGCPAREAADGDETLKGSEKPKEGTGVAVGETRLSAQRTAQVARPRGPPREAETACASRRGNLAVRTREARFPASCVSSALRAPGRQRHGESTHTSVCGGPAAATDVGGWADGDIGDRPGQGKPLQGGGTSEALANEVNPRVGSGMQQACRPVGGVNRRGGEEPRGRNETGQVALTRRRGRHCLPREWTPTGATGRGATRASGETETHTSVWVEEDPGEQRPVSGARLGSQAACDGRTSKGRVRLGGRAADVSRSRKLDTSVRSRRATSSHRGKVTGLWVGPTTHAEVWISTLAGRRPRGATQPHGRRVSLDTPTHCERR
jgi:hypothetical protein